jgi:hypothetical protein
LRFLFLRVNFDPFDLRFFPPDCTCAFAGAGAGAGAFAGGDGAVGVGVFDPKIPSKNPFFGSLHFFIHSSTFFSGVAVGVVGVPVVPVATGVSVFPEGNGHHPPFLLLFFL